jgi:hypothetical protein
MIRKVKGLELMKNIFITDLNTFGSNTFLTLKIMDFQNATLTKVIHIYVIKRKNTWYMYDVKSICSQNTYLYLTCSVKLGIQNTKF